MRARSARCIDRLMRWDMRTPSMHARVAAILADRAWFRNNESGSPLDEAET
jgi:hypothetical protein